MLGKREIIGKLEHVSQLSASFRKACQQLGFYFPFCKLNSSPSQDPVMSLPYFSGKSPKSFLPLLFFPYLQKRDMLRIEQTCK
jgi:hypothetical protein